MFLPYGNYTGVWDRLVCIIIQKCLTWYCCTIHYSTVHFFTLWSHAVHRWAVLLIGCILLFIVVPCFTLLYMYTVLHMMNTVLRCCIPLCNAVQCVLLYIVVQCLHCCIYWVLHMKNPVLHGFTLLHSTVQVLTALLCYTMFYICFTCRLFYICWTLFHVALYCLAVLSNCLLL